MKNQIRFKLSSVIVKHILLPEDEVKEVVKIAQKGCPDFVPSKNREDYCCKADKCDGEYKKDYWESVVIYCIGSKLLVVVNQPHLRIDADFMGMVDELNSIIKPFGGEGHEKM